MNEENILVEFSPELLTFLKRNRYSHVLCIGATNTKDPEDSFRDDYKMIALLPEDLRLQFEESDYIVHKIESGEVTDMSEGFPFIRFMIEVPRIIYKRFMISNSNQ